MGILFRILFLFPNIIPANCSWFWYSLVYITAQLFYWSPKMYIVTWLSTLFSQHLPGRKKIHGKTWFWKNLSFIHHRPWHGSTVNPSHVRRSAGPFTCGCSEWRLYAPGALSEVEETLSLQWFPVRHLSSDQNPGYWLYRGDHATQLYRDYNTPLWGSLLAIQYNGMSQGFWTLLSFDFPWDFLRILIL